MGWSFCLVCGESQTVWTSSVFHADDPWRLQPVSLTADEQILKAVWNGCGKSTPRCITRSRTCENCWLKKPGAAQHFTQGRSWEVGSRKRFLRQTLNNWGSKKAIQLPTSTVKILPGSSRAAGQSVMRECNHGRV